MRQGTCRRETTETAVAVELGLDGAGAYAVRTGVAFLDHMLEQFSRHSLIDLTVRAEGDTEIDAHHTVEDVGIAIGRALREAVGDARGIRRYGFQLLPMDEALTRVAVDVSGRPCLGWRSTFPAARVGDFDTELVREFFHALAMQAGMTLHVETLAGANAHHMIECCFKAAGRAVRMAVEPDPRAPDSAPSTKGVLGANA